jgi:hypothetical protein
VRGIKLFARAVLFGVLLYFGGIASAGVKAVFAGGVREAAATSRTASGGQAERRALARALQSGVRRANALALVLGLGLLPAAARARRRAIAVRRPV